MAPVEFKQFPGSMKLILEKQYETSTNSQTDLYSFPGCLSSYNPDSRNETSSSVTQPSSHKGKTQTNKHYSVTNDDVRLQFIHKWNNGAQTIKQVSYYFILISGQAAKECGINYSTAKSIVKLLKIEGRIEKKKKRISRKVKKERE